MRRPRIAYTVVAISVIIAAITAAGSAHGAPYRSGPTHSTSVSADGTAIISTLTDATFARTPNGVDVVDDTGRVIDHIDSTVDLDDAAVPLRTTVSDDGRVATIAPVLTDRMRSGIARDTQPVSARKDRAFDTMIWHVANGLNRAGTVGVGIGAAIGAVVGGLAGLVVGCAVVAGCVWLGVAGAAGGAAVGAAIGGTVGTGYGDPRAGQAVLDWVTTR